MTDLTELTIDWNRSILIDSQIDEEMVRQLTPKILALRQQSGGPITIGIDSPGGSLASLDVLLSLLTGPDQEGKETSIITVSTNKAYSAAANFLAFGTYAVAMPHSQILFHDVRYGGMEDVTPEKARLAARSLNDANDMFSLRLAHRVIRRMIWAYIDLRPKFRENNEKHPKMHQVFSSTTDAYAPPVDAFESVDLASFATILWATLSSKNDTLIMSVMRKLSQWVHLNKIANSSPAYRLKGSRTAGLLDGSRHLYKLFKGENENFTSIEDDLKLILSLIVADVANKGRDRVMFPDVLDRASREYAVIESMNDRKHIQYASRLMKEQKHVFFRQPAEGLSEEQLVEALSKAEPYARLLWHFCVLLCRELFEGDHVLTPEDAQLLGLVDEVSGGGPIESRRDFVKEHLRNSLVSQPVLRPPQ